MIEILEKSILSVEFRNFMFWNLSYGEKNAECDESSDGGDVMHPEDNIGGLEWLCIEDLSLQVLECASQCFIHYFKNSGVQCDCNMAE